MLEKKHGSPVPTATLAGCLVLAACSQMTPAPHPPVERVAGEGPATNTLEGSGESAEGLSTEPPAPELTAPVRLQVAATEVASEPSTVSQSPCPEGMKLVPGGSFVTAMNKRSVSVGDLCVDTYETTAAEYKECVDAGKCSTNLVLCSEQSTWGNPDKQNHPMVCVDFSQAVDYCSFKEKRLPETSEWEWAARGGDAGRKYPWGDEEPNDQLCWQGKKPLTGTCPVGSFPGGVSAHGIHDLSGGVHEYTVTAQDATSVIRIARGGSWKEGDAYMMWPGRIGGFETSYRCGFLGIRCVTEPVSKSEGGAPSSPAAAPSGPSNP